MVLNLKKIDLSDVTLVIIDDYGDNLTKNNIRYIINEGINNFALENIQFGDVIEVTPFGNHSHINFEPGQKGYSKFCVKELPFLIKTKYYLIQQWDGFIINPQKWSSDFFEYEYIGGGHTLQCGGFSLRKTKDMIYIAEHSDDSVCDDEFEDGYYSRFFNSKKDSPPPFEYSFKVPFDWPNTPSSVTERFCSFLTPNLNAFGFHFNGDNDFDYLDYYKITNKFTDSELVKIGEYIKEREIRWQ